MPRVKQSRLQQLIIKNIVLRRKQRSLTQVELAALLGVRREYVACIESGRRKIDLDRLFEISTCLDCTYLDLLPNPAELGQKTDSKLDKISRSRIENEQALLDALK